jgi:peptide-methionine (S)-S-oxide reductase
MATESIVLGGGCFWCLEASYQLIEGVTAVTSGYAGGSTDNPDYYGVSSGKTGHAEVVKVDFDPSIINLDDILDIFWAIHDPTTLNRQGHDVGSQYRSVILYDNKEQETVALASKKKASALWEDPIVTEIVPLKDFYKADPEHQNYFKNHPEQAYCQVIINPKLQKLRAKFASRLKK